MSGEEEIYENPDLPMTYLAAMNKMRMEGIPCDVTLQVGDRSFSAHRQILMKSSEYFLRMFSSGMKESHEEVIPLFNVQETTFEKILGYIYTGRVQISKDEAKDLWIASDFYGFIGIRDKCANVMIDDLKNDVKIGQCIRTFSDVWDIRNIAKFMQNDCLIATVDKYIGYYLKEFMTSQEFLKLNADDFLELIGSDFLWTKTEKITFEAGMQWIEICQEDRTKFLPDVLAKIRFSCLSVNFLCWNVCVNHLIRNSEECQRLVEKNLKGEISRSRSRAGEIYVFGEKSMEFYNPIVQEWHEGEASPSEKTQIGVVFLKNKMYILAGCIGDSDAYESVVDIYEPKPPRWTKGPEMILARSYPAVAVDGNMIYVCGGLNCDELKDVECFNSDINQWNKLPPMMSCRMSACAVALDGFIYVMGGYQEDQEVLNSVERFDVERKIWERVEPMLTKRGFFGAATLNGKIYVCGGQDDDNSFASVEVYSPKQNTWQLIKPMNTNRTKLAVVSYMGKIWAIGGISDYFKKQGHKTLNTVEVYDPARDDWTFETPMNSYRNAVVAGVFL